MSYGALLKGNNYFISYLFFNFEPGIEAIGLMDSSKFYWGTLVPSWYDWDLDVCPAQRWWGIGFCWQLVLHLEVIDAHIRAQAWCRSWLVIAITFRRCCEQDGPVIGCPEPGVAVEHHWVDLHLNISRLEQLNIGLTTASFGTSQCWNIMGQLVLE